MALKPSTHVKQHNFAKKKYKKILQKLALADEVLTLQHWSSGELEHLICK